MCSQVQNTMASISMICYFVSLQELLKYFLSFPPLETSLAYHTCRHCHHTCVCLETIESSSRATSEATQAGRSVI